MHHDYINTASSTPSSEPLYPLIGLEPFVREHLAKISGGTPEIHWQREGGTETWKAATDLERVQARSPMFITNSWSVIDPDHANLEESNPPRWHLASVVWIDIDATSLEEAITAARRTGGLLVQLGIEPECCSLFLSGGRGFHIAIPLALMVSGGVEALGRMTAKHWPRICRAFVESSLLVDGTDLNIYSGGKGRMFRQPNVQRPNGLHKVAMPWGMLDTITPQGYSTWCSEPRELLAPAPVSAIATPAAVAWACAYARTCQPPKQAKKRPQTPVLTAGGALRPAERTKVLKALAKINVNAIEYADWVRVGSALKSTGASDALGLWTAWSKGYRGRRRCRDSDCVNRWKGLNGNCTLGTLYFLAQKGGRP